MNNENELNPQDKRSISIENGNYNEKFRDYYDERTYNYPEIQSIDEIAGIPNNLPLTRSLNFVGREDDLKSLHKLLQSNQAVVISAVAGMGGVGKTELVMQYALQYEQEYPGSICWLRARENIGIQIVNFAKSLLNLNIPENLDLETQVRYCWGHWRKGNSLIVLDDVPNYGKHYQENIQPYLPSKQEYINLLLTSRQQPGKNIQHLNLDVLSPDTASELIISLAVNSEIDFTQDKEQLLQLCEWLGYLPLGLELVGRYLDVHPTYSIEKVIEKLEKSKLKAKALLHPEEADMTGQLGVAAAFDLSWSDIIEELANKNQKLANSWKELASYLGLFQSEAFIWSWAEDAFLESKDPEEIEEKIEELEDLRDKYLIKRNLLKRNSNQEYQLHSLIQQYFRAKLENLEQAELLKEKFTQPMIAIAQLIPETPTQKDITRVTLAIPHLSNVASELIDYVSDENLIWVFVGLGRFYAGQGSYNQAEQWHQKSLQVYRTRLGEKHYYVSISLNNLAASYSYQGRYSEAEPLYLQALEIDKKILGEEHPSVATSLNNLGQLYSHRGRYSEAEPLLKQALELRKKLFGLEHPDVATSLNNLGVFYDDQERYSEAESLLKQALELRKKLLGELNPDIAISLNNLGRFYRGQGKYSEAEPFYLQALELRKQLWGLNHHYVAQSLNNLAVLYDSQGKYPEAEPRYLQALEIDKKILGEEHPSVAESLNNLGELYREQGRYSEAEPLLKQALELRKKLFGLKNPSVATSLNNLALLYDEQEKYSEAEPLYLQALELRKQLFGEEHTSIAESLNNLAALYDSQERYSEAELLYQQALEIYCKLLGEENPYVGTILNNLAILYESQARYEVAESFYQEALTIAEVTLGANHPNTNRIRESLQRTLDKMQN
ncbi:MAG: tetratricopeptide repeat protein [Xenococcus sp. (in: cyanobacteria)]